MVKLATLGQNPRALTDCSEVIPVPKVSRLPPATLPAGKTLKDIEASVRTTHCNLFLAHAVLTTCTVPPDALPRYQGRSWSRDDDPSRVRLRPIDCVAHVSDLRFAALLPKRLATDS